MGQKTGHALDEPAFAALFERHRGELRVHCYRMLGSFEEAEDLVQETFTRAWRARAGFGADGRAAPRAWLYRIATNACLDVLRTRPRKVVPEELGPAADPTVAPADPVDLPWLQPYPDHLLDPAADDPAAAVVERETIELAFIATIQHLPPRQRAVAILRDVLGWPAKDVAALLDVSVASANSALQRARATLRERLGARRTDWSRASTPTAQERELLRRYIDAHDQRDAHALAAILREDARLTMPPHPVWFDGRDAIITAVGPSFEPAFGRMRHVATAANRQPAVGHYLRPPGEERFSPIALDVLHIEDGLIVKISTFATPELFPAFGLPPDR